MMGRVLVAVVLSLVFLPASASQPGQPLDCSDWVFFEPGLTCTTFAVYEGEPSSIFIRGKGSNLVADNEGRLLTLRFTYVEVFNGDPGGTLARTEIVRHNGQTEEVLARIEDRLFLGARDFFRPLTYWDYQINRGSGTDAGLSLEPTVFDAVNGVLYLFVETHGLNTAYPKVRWIAAIHGFPTLFEILQTYTPTAGPISFRVPAMPEGFHAADHFDTYAGNLTHPIDFSQAQGIQCNYPSSPPSVGDYFTVADPLPTPTPGHAYYYVTAVTYQGQTRYGRQREDGVTTGRDPSLLPSCSP